jgi:hypothetical protein
MHPKELTIDPKAVCRICEMKLIRRRISPSTIYEKPGEPSMRMELTPAAPLEAGKPMQVAVMLSFKKENAPVRRQDLLTMHTEKIHLLIIDPTLTDYHHEHPAPTDSPGRYTFSFTPRTPGPYRIFADLVPAETGVQEYIVADLPGPAVAAEIPDRATRLSATVDGFHFNLAQVNPRQPIRAGEIVPANLTVTAADGKPFKALEPLMGAYAHLVAFHEDKTTVLHMHPAGPDPVKPEDRGGPTLRFNLYAPKPGFYRLYAQVRIGDQSRFAAFNVNVLPAEAPK